MRAPDYAGGSVDLLKTIFGPIHKAPFQAELLWSA